MSRGRTLIRFDQRGNGLSEQNPCSFAFERWIEDLEAVVDAAGLERFDLFGASQGGSSAIAYGARHPERVNRMVIYGSYTRGQMLRDDMPGEQEAAQALLHAVRLGWGKGDAAFRHVFAMKFMPDADKEMHKAFDELARICTPAENAVQLIQQFFTIDIRDAAKTLRCPTLILHARHDQRAPYQEGLKLASLIPRARLVTLDSHNHILVGNEPAFRRFCDELDAFLGGSAPRISGLTERESQILECIAQGLDNAQIAARLEMSEKTVRNHITHIFDKLGVENRSQAIVMAREAGLGQQSRRS